MSLGCSRLYSIFNVVIKLQICRDNLQLFDVGYKLWEKLSYVDLFLPATYIHWNDLSVVLGDSVQTTC